jgi:hypothetical protein
VAHAGEVFDERGAAARVGRPVVDFLGQGQARRGRLETFCAPHRHIRRPNWT